MWAEVREKAAKWLEAISPRARRAVSLMLVAIIAVAATSVYFLRPWIEQRPVAATSLTGTSDVQPSYFFNYDFKSPALGWAVEVEAKQGSRPDVGRYWIFRTVDGGRHWQRQFRGQSQTAWMTLNTLHFVDLRTGFFLAGDPMSLYRTRDGGDHWTSLALPPNAEMAQFADPGRGWAATGSDLYSTSDGGGTWSAPKKLPTDTMGSMPTFRDGSEGWVGGGGTDVQPHVYATRNDGVSWRRLDLPRSTDASPDEPAGTFVQLLPGHGVMVYVFQQGPGTAYTYTTFDGGKSWTVLAVPPTPGGNLGPLAFEDATHWWMVFALELFKTADAGQTWTQVDAYVPGEVRQLQILDARHAWGLTGDGLAFTSDGGTSWTRVKPPTEK